MQRLEGVDTSYAQPNVQWSQVKSAGKDYAFVKATEGIGGKDHTFPHNWSELEKLELPRIAYHFFYDFLDPVIQCDRFHEYVRENGQFSEGDGIMLDVEEVSITDAERARHYMESFVTHAWQTIDKAVIIYTNPDTWINLLGDPESSVLSQCPLFLADYGPMVPSLRCWPHGLSFWQYSDVGHCPGIQGYVDLSRFYGDTEQLTKLLSTVPKH